MLFKHIGRLAVAAGLAAGLFTSGAAYAETQLVVGYQQIVGPFIAAIADGRFDAAAKEAGYTIDWRQFSSGGDISTALASGDVPIGVLGSTGITAATTRGVDLELFWILDNIGKSEALVAREGSNITKPEDLKGKKVGVPEYQLTANVWARAILEDDFGAAGRRRHRRLHCATPAVAAA